MTAWTLVLALSLALFWRRHKADETHYVTRWDDGTPRPPLYEPKRSLMADWRAIR